VWSEEPYRFEINGDKLLISNALAKIETGRNGNSLAGTQKFVANKFFPASGKLPDELLFAAPQYNTWIELTYNQNQEDVLKYAKAIIENGLPPGVLMIDDTWHEDY
jgi:alpha-glucosidase